MISGFTDRDVPEQTGRTHFITGANTGIGFEVARVLASRGARVVLGCRDRAKAEEAVARIRAETPDADLDIVGIDLGNLASVRAAAQRVAEEPRLDVLINNAGVMFPPRQLTADGFEMQFGVNHLGHFALTGLLLPTLLATEGSRVINTSSWGHRLGTLDFNDLHAEHSYNPVVRYGASKLANLLHTYELDRRLRERSAPTIALAVHPGGTDTELTRHLPRPLVTVLRPALRPFMNQAPSGAWPTLLGATHPEVEGGQYFGPSGFLEMYGPAREATPNRLSREPELARRLWEVSVDLTGVHPDL